MRTIILSLFAITVMAGISCSKDSAGVKSMDSNVTGSGGSRARFAIQGNYLYMVDKSDLKVFDIADAANPVLKNTTPVGFEIETIYPFGDKLFIGSTSVVHIFSVTDPEHPAKLSTAISPEVLRRCDPVVANDSVAYATLRTNGPCGGIQSILAVYDIKDITKPVVKNSYPVLEPYGLGYQDSALYVCDITGLLVFNISKGYSPIYITTKTNPEQAVYQDVIPYNDVLICWVSKGMILYDIKERLDPKLITTIY
jgi:hypothetical protein